VHRDSGWFPLLLLAAMSSGCGGSEVPEDRRSSMTVTAVPIATTDTTAPPGGVRDQCPGTGLWAVCSVEKRLRQSGFVAKKVEGESPRRPGFSVEPVAYTMGRGRLELFFYDSEAALARDMTAMDTLLVAPPGTPSPWESTPLLVRSANLAAVYVGANPRQAERLMLALTAGAPQPLR